MADAIEYGDVVQENRGSLIPGRLRLQPESVIFKNIKSGRVDTVQSSELTKAAWLLRARGMCLKLTTDSGSIHRFDGLKETEYDKLEKFLQNNYKIPLEKKDISYRGWNWGKADFVGNAMDFVINDKLAFDVPLSNVSHSAVGKNEVTLQFHQNDDAVVALMEMRFHLPPSADDQDDPCEIFSQKCLEKADIIQMTGDAIAVFQEMVCLTPRGRYDIKIFPSCLQLHGKTFDYKIPFDNILRLFLLPHRDGRQMFFVISLDPPIKQGQTRYPFLILLFNKEDETVLELQLSDEDLTGKYEGKLQKEMAGLEYEVVSRIMKTFVNKKITVPGSFLGNSQTQSVACSYKAATGFLYPLERGFIFMHKPPVHIRFDEVAFVNFARGSGITRSFDFDIETKTAGTTYTFVGIEKDEYGKLYDFVSEKKLRVKNVDKGGSVATYEDALGSSDDDGKHDAYMARMKAEGKQRAEDDESMSSDDCDYQLPDYGSEVAEEWDTDYASDTEDEDFKPASGDDSDAIAEKEAKKEEKDKRKAEKLEKRREKQKEKRTKAPPKEPGEKRKRLTKKVKQDPTMPKRAQTAYFLWLADNREQIKTDNPGIAVTEILKTAGVLWGKLTPSDKEKYEAQYQTDKERYQEAMEIWKKEQADKPQAAASEDEAEDEASQKSKKPKAAPSKKSPPKPKPTTTSQGAGQNFKSKEFIEDDSSSDDEGGAKAKAKAKTKKAQDSDKAEDSEKASEAASSAAPSSGEDAGGEDADSE